MTTLDQYVGLEKHLDTVRDRHAIEEIYVPNSEEASPWVPFIENVWIRHLKFDVVNNAAVNILKVAAGGSLGVHRHRGPVTGYVLEGSFRYAEYDWVAKKGEFIAENPGRAHTLISDEGMETLFHLNGSEEFLDEHGNITEIVDVFWFINHYESYCKEHNIPINKGLYV